MNKKMTTPEVATPMGRWRTLAARCLNREGTAFSRPRNALFVLFIGGILAYGAGFAWYMLARFDLINIIRDVSTDDAFYYFQIARNLAEGKFSTFDGGITRTNGYHPLWLYLITPFYWVFDREAALFAIKAFEIMLVAGGVALVTAAARLARMLERKGLRLSVSTVGRILSRAIAAGVVLLASICEGRVKPMRRRRFDGWAHRRSPVRENADGRSKPRTWRHGSKLILCGINEAWCAAWLARLDARPPATCRNCARGRLFQRLRRRIARPSGMGSCVGWSACVAIAAAVDDAGFSPPSATTRVVAGPRTLARV